MSNRRISKSAASKAGNYDLQSKSFQYRAREDNTLLTPNILISPSQNVVTNTAGRISLVKGYKLDGSGSSAADSGILSNFDFTNFKGDVRNMRAGFLTSAGNDGKLQYRYVTGTSTVNWVDLKTGLSNVIMDYTEYWDNTNKVKLCLWVDGTSNVFAWNGAVTTFASATATEVTKEGTLSWAEEGFTQTGTRSIVINGQAATYTGGENTTTLTGVSFDFSATAVGSIVHQQPVTTALSAMTSISATYKPTCIGCGRQNQVYLGSSSSNLLYISKVNDYTNYTYTTPVRVVGEGALIPLDSPAVKFIPQEAHGNSDLTYDMWISEGKDRWAIIRSTLSSDLSKETLEHIRMKAAPMQGCYSTRLATKMKNHILFVAADKTINTLGFMSYQYVPVIQDISYPIVDDQSNYDLTNGSIFYHKNYIYEAVPEHGLIRIYNMTDQTQQQFSSGYPIEQINSAQPWYWEAPVAYPVSGFYVVDGELYGHSFTSSESYKLFTGGTFNGQDITGVATFAFDDHGDRTQSKGSNELWVEGYIKQNTTITATVTGDLDTFATGQSVEIQGNNNAYVAYGGGANAIGKNHLGASPLGGSYPGDALPAWFHVAKTYNQVSCYLEQVSFYTKGKDLQWEILAYGTNAALTTEGNNSITD